MAPGGRPGIRPGPRQVVVLSSATVLQPGARLRQGIGAGVPAPPRWPEARCALGHPRAQPLQRLAGRRHLSCRPPPVPAHLGQLGCSGHGKCQVCRCLLPRHDFVLDHPHRSPGHCPTILDLPRPADAKGRKGCRDRYLHAWIDVSPTQTPAPPFFSLPWFLWREPCRN